jgi:hypothetical protein
MHQVAPKQTNRGSSSTNALTAIDGGAAATVKKESDVQDARRAS